MFALNVEPSGLLVWSIHALLLISACGLVLRREGLKGTTLFAPFCWGVFSLLALGGSFLIGVLGQLDESSQAAFRYLAATSTFCPLMAILGAKRPQNVGWQLIVLTLWVVLVLPAGEMALLWQGGALDIGPMRQWLLVILIGVGVVNYALTRFAVAGLLYGIGQVFLLFPLLPIVGIEWSWHWLVGVVLIVAAVLLLQVLTWRNRPNDHGWERVWRDFRDAFGVVWSLRVIERFNATAKLASWETELNWYGLDGSEKATQEEASEIERCIRTLLRRFVSAEWIDDRLRKAD